MSSARLEPRLFVVGYYLGHLPARQNEQTQKDESDRQAQQAREALEEKIMSARAVLTPRPAAGPEASRHPVAVALRILNS